MAIAIVEFRPPVPVSFEQAVALFEKTAPHYVDLSGLIRKHYFRSEEGDVVGAIYEWRCRAAGEAVYGGEWRERVGRHYGADPKIIWLETPIVVDNVMGRIVRPDNIAPLPPFL